MEAAAACERELSRPPEMPAPAPATHKSAELLELIEEAKHYMAMDCAPPTVERDVGAWTRKLWAEFCSDFGTNSDRLNPHANDGSDAINNEIETSLASAFIVGRM